MARVPSILHRNLRPSQLSKSFITFFFIGLILSIGRSKSSDIWSMIFSISSHTNATSRSVIFVISSVMSAKCLHVLSVAWRSRHHRHGVFITYPCIGLRTQPTNVPRPYGRRRASLCAPSRAICKAYPRSLHSIVFFKPQSTGF